MHFDGAVYDHEVDGPRLEKQFERIRDLMIDGVWRTLQEIADITQDPPASVSAQLRNLRKAKFGGFTLEKRRRHTGYFSGLFEYQLSRKGEQKSWENL